MKSVEIWYGGEPYMLERVNGLWRTFSLGRGYLFADTIVGIINLLRA